jgi:hypothetical protein
MSEHPPVTWQTLFFALLPLAINNWGQPSGRVLSLPPEHRIYIQSFPVFAAFDALSIITGFVYLKLTARLPAGMTLGVIMHQRFEGCDESQSLKALKRTRWLRWLGFLLGVIQPAIKLASFNGVSFSHAFGFMWLGSWVVIEIVALLAREVDVGDSNV